MARADRPLSPHLQIYRWYLTMALSIAHRATGAILTFGIVMLAIWLMALAGSRDSFATMRAVMDNVIGWLVLFGLTFALFFHTLNVSPWPGTWASGSKGVARQSGMIVVGAAVLTVITGSSSSSPPEGNRHAHSHRPGPWSPFRQGSRTAEHGGCRCRQHLPGPLVHHPRPSP
ncbi:MAG: succinate dehydrogenase, cytochrome b556 subunit [Geminicoccaceae bacterium]